MKRAVVALDSTSCSGETFDRIADTIGFFQKKGLIAHHATIASIYHASLTALPYQFYAEEKGKLMKDAQTSLRLAVQNQFHFDSVRVLESASSYAEDHVQHLSRYAKRIGAELLVLGSNDRSGLPYWYLGSFSETAALRANIPVLIFKPSVQSLTLSREPRFVVAVDVAAPPSDRMIEWIGNFATSVRAVLELIHVIPQYRAVVDSIQLRKSRAEVKESLQSLKMKFGAHSLRSQITVKDEAVSIGHTIARFADEKNAWITVTTAAERSRARKLILGSKARHILALSKRPFLSVRLE